MSNVCRIVFLPMPLSDNRSGRMLAMAESRVNARAGQ
jgi:hypothetical protein